MNKENKFFEKFLENLSRLDEINIKNLLESVENDRRTFRMVLDALDEGLMLIHEDKVVFFNQEAARLCGAPSIKTPFTVEEMARTFKNANVIEPIVASLRQDDFKAEFTDAGSRERRFYSLTKITTEQHFVILKFEDITENKNLEFRIKHLESLSALNTLAAGIAHEIKNPLAAIDLHTQILKKGIDRGMVHVSDEVANFIQIIDDEQKRLGKVVNDFLTTARKHELKPSFVDINEYLRDILEFLKPEIENSRIELVFDTSPCPKLFLDPDYLRQAIVNLIKNAIESMASPKKDPTILPVLTVRTFYDRGSDSVGIAIQDRGHGIDPDKIQKIFEPYYTTKDFGTGLGLTIVYKIVKEHGGDLRVESERGKGSSFTVYLPISQGQKLITNCPGAPVCREA